MPLTEEKIALLKEKAWLARRNTIQTLMWAGGGHAGGGLSQIDILITLYYHYLNIDPQKPGWEDRDRVVLSKGHGGISYAPILAELGYFKHELLKEFNHTGSPFGMHLDMLRVPGVDASTGSLGHGLPIAVGLALGARLKKKSWRVYCILGDGECQEGSIWEAAMSAAHYRVDNLTVFIDRNKHSIDGPTEKVMSLEPLREKWISFGWHTLEIKGHDFSEISGAVDEALQTAGRPTVIIAHTIKGKGVDYMEDDPAWHYGGIDSDGMERALQSIDRMYGKA